MSKAEEFLSWLYEGLSRDWFLESGKIEVYRYEDGKKVILKTFIKTDWDKNSWEDEGGKNWSNRKVMNYCKKMRNQDCSIAFYDASGEKLDLIA